MMIFYCGVMINVIGMFVGVIVVFGVFQGDDEVCFFIFFSYNCCGKEYGNLYVNFDYCINQFWDKICFWLLVVNFWQG